MKNKWSLYKDSEIWRYSFNNESLKENNFSFLDLFRFFVLACYDSNLSKLTDYNKSRNEDYSIILNNLLQYLERLKTDNSYGFFPKISSDSIYNLGKETFYNYTFNNNLYCYDKDGKIVENSFSHSQINNFLEEINHGQKNDQGFLLPFEFETNYGMGPEGSIKSFDFLIKFNADIWLKKVPCIHCERQISNEELRKINGGLNKIEAFWHDNTELAELNRKKINVFMVEMDKLIQKLDGKILVESENFHFYKSFFTVKGFTD